VVKSPFSKGNDQRRILRDSVTETHNTRFTLIHTSGQMAARRGKANEHTGDVRKALEQRSFNHCNKLKAGSTRTTVVSFVDRGSADRGEIMNSKDADNIQAKRPLAVPLRSLGWRMGAQGEAMDIIAWFSGNDLPLSAADSRAARPPKT